MRPGLYMRRAWSNDCIAEKQQAREGDKLLCKERREKQEDETYIHEWESLVWKTLLA